MDASLQIGHDGALDGRPLFTVPACKDVGATAVVDGGSTECAAAEAGADWSLMSLGPQVWLSFDLPAFRLRPRVGGSGKDSTGFSGAVESGTVEGDMLAEDEPRAITARNAAWTAAIASADGASEMRACEYIISWSEDMDAASPLVPAGKLFLRDCFNFFTEADSGTSSAAGAVVSSSGIVTESVIAVSARLCLRPRFGFFASPAASSGAGAAAPDSGAAIDPGVVAMGISSWQSRLDFFADVEFVASRDGGAKAFSPGAIASSEKYSESISYNEHNILTGNMRR